MKLPAPVSFAAGLVPALAAGWLLFPRVLYTKEAQPIAFSHKAHGPDGAGMTCDQCHALGDDGRFQGVPATSSCAACHSEKSGKPAVDALVEKYVTPGREVPWLVYARQPDNTFFPHAPHVKAGALPCERCHGPQGSSSSPRAFVKNRLTGESQDVWGPSQTRHKAHPWEGMKMADCIRCHRSSGHESACIDCHR